MSLMERGGGLNIFLAPKEGGSSLLERGLNREVMEYRHGCYNGEYTTHRPIVRIFHGGGGGWGCIP